MGFIHAYLGIYGGGAGAVSVADETDRQVLFGTSLQRQTLQGTTLERERLYGASLVRQTLRGSTP